nr:MAG TPA: hypothetical protein [Caudoviricetes sp.]
MKCNECSNANICLDHIEILGLGGCTSGIPDCKVITNADRIRNMSDEELAEFLDIVGEDGISSQYTDVPCDCCSEKTECSKCWKEWLQSEAE